MSAANTLTFPTSGLLWHTRTSILGRRSGCIPIVSVIQSPPCACHPECTDLLWIILVFILTASILLSADDYRFWHRAAALYSGWKEGTPSISRRPMLCSSRL